MIVLSIYLPLIFLGLSIVLGALALVAYNCDWNDALSVCLMILCIVSFALIFVALFVGEPVYEEEYDKTINLYALDSGNGVKGTFLLGSGSVNDVQYYIGYTNVGGKDYAQVKFDASKSILRLDDEEIPRAEMYKIHSFGNVFGLFLIDKGYSGIKAILYIPTTGLKNVYEVN